MFWRFDHVSTYQNLIRFHSWVTFHYKALLPLFIRSSTGRHLGCFHLWTIMKSATVNTGITSLWNPASNALAIYTQERTYWVTGWSYHLTSRETTTVFSVTAAPLCILTSNGWKLQCAPVLINTCLCFNYSTLTGVRWRLTVHFCLHSPNDYGYWESSHVLHQVFVCICHDNLSQCFLLKLSEC